MLERKAYDKLLAWKNEAHGSTALLLEGARRVGKSTLVAEFGTREYTSCIIVDFTSVAREVQEYFEDLRNDLDAFFIYLSAFYGVELHERASLIVFDEVQSYPLARQALKQLVADGRYDYIETGSLVSIKENVRDILIPSEEQPLSLDPLDFEEFLWAMNERPLARAIHHAFDEREALPNALHRKAARLFREYMLVGGMPQAVQTYVDTRDFGKVDAIKRSILNLYRNDIAKHAGTQLNRVNAIFDEIPAQLSKHEKKFTLSALGKDARMRSYEDAFFWLSDARVTNNCFCSSDPSVGLGLNADYARVKCYMADTGLLGAHAFADNDSTDDGGYRDILLGKISINEGMIVENAVAQALHARGHRLFFYSGYNATRKHSLEIDFLIACAYSNAAMKRRISPIEVKSSTHYETRSLDRFKQTFGKRIGTQYVVHPSQFKVEGERVFLPLYMAFCL